MAINKQLENLKINLEEKKRYFEKARLKLAQEELELQEVEEKLKTTKNKLYSGEISSPKELSQWERTVEKLGRKQKFPGKHCYCFSGKYRRVARRNPEKNSIVSPTRGSPFFTSYSVAGRAEG